MMKYHADNTKNTEKFEQQRQTIRHHLTPVMKQ